MYVCDSFIHSFIHASLPSDYQNSSIPLIDLTGSDSDSDNKEYDCNYDYDGDDDDSNDGSRTARSPIPKLPGDWQDMDQYSGIGKSDSPNPFLSHHIHWIIIIIITFRPRCL